MAKKEFVSHVPNLGKVRDLAQYGQFLDRLEARGQGVFDEGRQEWRNPSDVKQELKLK